MRKSLKKNINDWKKARKKLKLLVEYELKTKTFIKKSKIIRED